MTGAAVAAVVERLRRVADLTQHAYPIIQMYPSEAQALLDHLEGLTKERDDARKSLGEYSKHEIGQTLAGGVNNLRQIAITAKENLADQKADLRVVAAQVKRQAAYIHEILDHHGDWEACGSTSCDEAQVALDRPGVAGLGEGT